jgi:hypothetical protein
MIPAALVVHLLPGWAEVRVHSEAFFSNLFGVKLFIHEFVEHDGPIQLLGALLGEWNEVAKRIVDLFFGAFRDISPDNPGILAFFNGFAKMDENRRNSTELRRLSLDFFARFFLQARKMSAKTDQFAFDTGSFALYASLVAELPDDESSRKSLSLLLESPDRSTNKPPNLLFLQSLREICGLAVSIRPAVFGLLQEFISRDGDTPALVNSVFPVRLWFRDFLISPTDIVPLLSALDSASHSLMVTCFESIFSRCLKCQWMIPLSIS